MIAPNDIAGVLVTLHIEDDQKLFLMLTNDGMVRRLGNGSEDCNENELFIGKSNLNAFERVRSLSGVIIENWLGSYSDPEQWGKRCKLVVGFRSRKGEEFMSEWEYGTDSQGPPPEVSSLVIAAVEATNEWYNNQKRVATDNA